MSFRPKRWQVILAGIVFPSVLIGGLKWFVFEWAKDYLFGKLTEETEEVMTSAVGEVGWEAMLEWLAAGSLGLLIAIVLILVGYYFRGTPRATSATASPESGDKEGDAIDNGWSALAEKNPANTLVILSAGIERIRLQGVHPAWEIFFTAYNGGVGEVRLVSAGGSFKIRGQAYPTPVELKSATPAKHGEITLFTVRQWIEQQDVPQLQQGENHVVLQLSGLRIEAIATDPISGTAHPFVVPLPDHLQFDMRHHWRINPELFARFYRERLGTDDNKAVQTKATAQHDVRLSDALYWIIDNSDWGLGLGRDSFLERAAIVLRQAARDGEITIRGRRELPGYEPDGQFDNTWGNIEQNYWHTHEFEMTAVMCAEAHLATRETKVVLPSDVNAEAMPHYAMLRVWNDELEKRWPAVNISA